MIFYYGTRYLGVVDQVPGHLYVATRCRHVWGCPLVPLGSWALVEGTERFDIQGGEWVASGVQLPSVSARSVGFAWLRFLLVCALLGAGAIAVDPLLEAVFDGADPARALVWLGVVGAAFALVALSYRMPRANRARAELLCRALGLPEEAAA